MKNDDQTKRTDCFGGKDLDWTEVHPNAETIAAMEEARTRKLKSFNSVEALMEDLNAEE